MSLTQLLGGPQFDTVTNLDSALYADFHYFFNSGSVIRTNPWNSPSTPVAKRMTVTNITANDVALNYVNTSGSIVATTLTGSESRIIISQTLPLGLDTAPWLSVGSVTNHTGSVVARPTGSRFFEMAGIRTIAQSTNMYTIADSATTITKTSLSSPVSGSSLRYVCSRTIPYLDQPFWLIRDLYDCTGGTTTTTSTTTTTAAPSVITSGLVSWYSCDTLYGSNWLDKSGNSNHARVSGSTMTNIDSSGYLMPSGSGNYVVWPATINNSPVTEWTLQWVGLLPSVAQANTNIFDLWCKDTPFNGWDTIIRRFVSFPNYTYIFRDVPGSDMTFNSADVGWSLGQLTITADSFFNQVKVYVNYGTSYSFVTSSVGSVNDFNATSDRLVFGFNANTDARPLNTISPRVKDLLLYNTVLSQSDITNNWNALRNSGCSVAPTTTTTSTTTTTTTAGPTTTTTTTTLAVQKYALRSCIGPDDIIGVFNIANAPLLNSGSVIKIAGGGIAGYYCFKVTGASTATPSVPTNYTLSNIWQNAAFDCSVCSE